MKVTKRLSNYKILGEKKVIDDSKRIGEIMTGYVNIAFDNLKKLVEILKPNFPAEFKNVWYLEAFSTEMLNELKKNLYQVNRYAESTLLETEPKVVHVEFSP